ncbi:hypothetical protein [Streptomyces sp. NPDC007991]|uniref:hypothetical protein n=1 Tax=Streptomyces sp. NPDC007991 TaxID=3364803 RepID=UPI0036EE274F
MHDLDRNTKHQKPMTVSSGLDAVDRHVKAVWPMAESVAHGVRSTSCADACGLGRDPGRTGRAAVDTVVGLRETRPDSPVINAISGAAA